MGSIKKRDYAADLDRLKVFFDSYHSYHPDTGKKMFKYGDLVRDIANREEIRMEIDLDELADFDEELATSVRNNVIRYQRLVAQALDEVIPKYRSVEHPPVKDILDTYIEHRQLLEERLHPDPNEVRPSNERFPPQLMRRFEVSFIEPKARFRAVAVRDVKARDIGKLVSVKGIVTRATEVKPMLEVATYTCDRCGSEIFQPIGGPFFKPLSDCPSRDCTENKAGGRLTLEHKGSKFIKFQELRVQEHSDQVPDGGIPRQLTVHCSGENCREAGPGDHVVLQGVYLPVSAKSAFNRGLVSETLFQAHKIYKLNKAETNESEPLTQDEVNEIMSGNFYDKLSQSIAPEIFGHSDVKKALLLLLVGGTDKKTDSGMNIRGNLNICLMGDPGVAKSQLLSFIDRLSTRSQYTTGRGSSGVGLTACVQKDPITEEFVLEGGALVLADRGICCIDEFDKMAETDRVAIHEVMEQQTISIAKAGIMTSLNARVSILAAANPAFGKYNIHRTIEQNVNLPPALLSRFDLMWLLQDIPERENDLRLAHHVTYVHQYLTHPPVQTNPLSIKTMQRYLELCKLKNPTIPQNLTEFIITAYVELRKESREFTSARSLLSILRLSTAIAKLKLADSVTRDDVQEAMRLVEMSKDSLKGTKAKKRRRQRPSDMIYQEIREMLPPKPAAPTIKLADARNRAIARGFTNDQFEEAIEEYEELNVFSVNAAKTRLTVVMTS